jgi:hypothetical protein
MNENLPTNNQFQRFRKYYTVLEPVWDKPKNRVYTAIIFSFLAISLFGWYAIKPTIQTILILQKEIEEKKVVSQKMESKIEDLIKARIALDTVTPQLYLIDDAIPKNADALDLTLQIRNLINSSEATISSISISSVPISPNEANNKTHTEITNKPNSSQFQITALIGGNYTSLENVLKNINTMRRLISIDSLQIRDAKGNEVVTQNSTSSQLMLSLQIKSYYK